MAPISSGRHLTGPSTFPRHLRIAALATGVVALAALVAPFEVGVIRAVDPFLAFVEIQRDGVQGVNGLNGATSVTVSPDGNHVYAVGEFDDAVAVFSRSSMTGALTFVEFRKDGVGGVDGLNGAFSVTVSPDGRHLYAAGWEEAAVAVFGRNSTTGALTFVEAQRNGTGGVSGLRGVRSVAVSSDGKHLYTAGEVDDAVAVFSRNSTTGALTFVELQRDGEGGVDGLDVVHSLAVSPDGRHLYTAGGADSAVAVFSRNSTSGALTFVEVHRDGVGGVDGLDVAVSVTVSPDGSHLYAAGLGDSAVAVFSRNSTTGVLAFVEVQRDGVGGVDGLGGAHSVAASPDGRHVYAAGANDDAVVVFERNSTTGALTFVEFQKDGVGGVDGLDGAGGVTVSPDGKHLYATSGGDDAVAVFRIGAASAPTPPILSIADVTVDEGAGNAVLTISMESTTSTSVTVRYSTFDGTATSPNDYIATTTTIAIPANQRSTSVQIPIVDDGLGESDETFTVVLSNPSAGMEISGSNGTATVTILDNDTAPSISNPVSWWPGEGSADDIVGRNHGVLQNGAAFAAGKVGQAFSLDGIDDYVDLGNSATLHVSGGDFTIEAWVRFDTLTSDMSILDKMSPALVNSDGWRLLKQADNRVWFCLGGGGWAAPTAAMTAVRGWPRLFGARLVSSRLLGTTSPRSRVHRISQFM